MQSYSLHDPFAGAQGEDPDGDDYDGGSGDGNAEVKSEDKLKDDSKGGDKSDRKGVINRVNRACNNCRRMKMRCVGAEDPPCKRCRNAGLDCIMEKPGRAGASGEPVGEDRIRSLESQVTSIQNTLSDLVQTLRQGMSTSSAASNGSAHTPVNLSTTPEYAPNFGTAALGNILPQAAATGSSPRNPAFNPAAALAVQTRYSPTGITPPSFPQSGFIPQRSASHMTSTFNPYSASSSATLTLPSQVSADSPLIAAAARTSFSMPTDGSRGSPYPLGGDPSGGFRRPQPPAPSSVASAPTPNPPWQAFSTPGAGPQSGGRHMSLPPSRAGSEAPDDILAPDDIINPLGAMSNMAGLVEAAVERAREEQAKRGGSISGVSGQAPTPGATTTQVKRQNTDADTPGTDDSRGPQPKRARFSSVAPAVVEAQGLPQTLSATKPKSKVKRTHVHAYPDAVDEGYVPEDEGRELMGIFYAGSNNFVPCYDPNFDTWESLKIRSPFSITAIIMVGARVRDGGGPISDVQTACREHAQRIAVGTLFNPVARIEAVQAMIMLAAFSENGWLPGGHAVRMAIDMGINKSFIKLLRTGMGKGKTPEELEEERPLVVHSRVWFCLYLIEHQMAYGMGRPAILREDEAIHQCRRLLEHPLSITSDARLVSTVELTALRAPLHVELTAAPDLPIDQNTLMRLKQANQEFDSWERYWDRVLSDRFGKGRGDFFRESLVVQRQYAELFVNSQLLRGIREPSDVVSMPEEKRTLAIRAMRNAQHCLEICLRGENYRNGLRYAVHYTHVCAAFAASFLIRIARLFPQELNLKKTAKDVEELASVLAEIPAGRYARSLRLILRRARRAKVIPAPSTITSPSRMAMALPGLTGTPGMPGQSPMVAFSPSQLVNPSYLPTPTPGGTAVSPSNLILSAASQIINDSPQSAQEISEFDFLFAQENLERAGLQLGEGDQLPLFLDGHSLGSSLGPTDLAPFVGLENFFLPADVDNRLVGQHPNAHINNLGGGNGGPGGGQGGEGAGGDLWW